MALGVGATRTRGSSVVKLCALWVDMVISSQRASPANTEAPKSRSKVNTPFATHLPIVREPLTRAPPGAGAS